MAVRYEPLTERMLPRGVARWLAIAGWTSLPLVRILVFAALGAAAGIVPNSNEYFADHVPGILLNSYVLLLVLVGTGVLARQLATLQALGGSDTARLVRLNGSVVLPLLLALVMGLLNVVSEVQEYGGPAVAAAAVPFGVDALITLLIRIPQATALYSSVIALIVVAELGRHPLPGTFPEDRSLGVKAVGEMLTTILAFYVAIFIPTLVFGTTGVMSASRFGEFAATLSLFGLGLAAMLVAVWRMHGRMAEERSRQISEARARYAKAYRRAADDADPAAGWAVLKERELLDGAESIHQWPFDDRTQRILGLLLTGVITGIAVRVAALALGV